MSAHWPLVPLGEVLTKSEDWIDLDPEKSFREVTVRLWGKGVVLRRDASGAEIAGSRRLRVRAGQFILSRIDARNGAFGLIPDALDGAVVSNDFPVFTPNPSRLLPSFLSWISKTHDFVNLCKAASEGTTNRVRLQENRFLPMTIPLPPLPEQRRIVARIEELAAKIEEAGGLRRQTVEEANRLLILMAHRPDLDDTTKHQKGWVEIGLSEVIRQAEDAHAVKPDASYPNLGIYSFGHGLFKKPPIQGLSTSAKVLYRVRSGQFIYNRLFAFEGACGMVSDEFDGYFVSSEYPTFECNPNGVRVEFLYAYFKSLGVWNQVAAGSKGLGDRRQRVQPDDFLTRRLMLPPLEWQERIRHVMAEVDTLKQLQGETAAELDAMLPSILDKAFKAEL